MTDIKLRTRAAFTAQASAAITADAFSGGSQTDFDTASAGNADGCDHFDVEVDVTAGPSSDAVCEIWCEPLEHDGAGYASAYRIATVPISIVASSAAKYHVPIYNVPRKGRLKIKALNYGFTASLSVIPRYYSDT
jgi:hypothetical protein